MLKYGTGVYFSLNWILVRINRCLHHTWARQNTYYRRHIKYYVFFCILLKCCKRRNGTVGKDENKQNDKNWFYQRTSEHFKMFTKLILQLKSDRISFTVHDTIIIRLSMQIKRHPILKRLFTSKILAESMSQEISDGKSYRMIAPLRFRSYFFSDLPY